MAQLQPTTLTVTPTIGEDWINLPINPENIVRAYATEVQINGVDLNLYPAIRFDLVTGAIQYWIYGLGDTATRDADLVLVDAAIAASGLTAPVSNADLADMPPWTIKLRNNAVAGSPQDVLISALTVAGALVAADKFILEKSTGELRYVDLTALAAAIVGAAASTLSDVLIAGNTSGANDISMANLQGIILGVAGSRLDASANIVTLKSTDALKLGFNGNIMEISELAGQYFIKPDVSLINVQTTLANTRTTLNIQGNGAMNARFQTTYGTGVAGFTQFEQAATNMQVNFGGGQTLYIINGTKTNCDTAIRGQTDNNAFYLDASTDSVGIGTATPGEKLEVNGNVLADNFIGVSKLSHNVVTKTNADSPYTTDDGEVVLCNATAGNITVNLPATASNSGAQINIKKTDASANTITIDGSGAETIDGGLTATLTVQYESLTLVSDGSDWFII